MTNFELAIDEDGEPFGVPPQVAGWRVRRAADGRGRPLLVHGRGSEKGKPLIVRANASHAELLAAAGPGKYRLEAVDEHRQKVDGVPVACTGPLSADDDGRSDDDSSAEVLGGSALRQSTTVEDVLCQLVNANTQMFTQTVAQLGTVMSGVAELLHVVHNTGLTSRLPLPPAAPPAPPPPVEGGDDDEAEAEEAEDGASTSGISEVVRLLIKETVDKVVPLIFEKLTGAAGLGGLPLEALLDWRKAVPNPAAAPSAPAAPAASSTPTPPAPASRPTSAAAASYAASSPPSPSTPAPAGAGAAPSRESPPGAAPADPPTPPIASSALTQEDAAAMINAHVLQVWQGLSPPERARAGQLIARLTAKERTAWLAELARLTVPEAIARARAILHAQTPPASTTPQLPTATPQGDPS